MFERPILNRAIHIGLSPNASWEDVSLCTKLLFQPWKWKKGDAALEVEQWFKNYFGVEKAVSFNAGRSALLAILQALNLPKDSEVMLQAFTCVALTNSIKWAGYQPVYVDIDSTLNFSVSSAEKKLTPRTKIMIVQHTFGIPADMDKIVAFSKKHDLVLIEDCAHAFGATYKGKLIGTFGDAAFFSFGRDKIVSSVFGGMAIINNSKLKNQNEKLQFKIQKFQSELSFPKYTWILQQLLHPIITLPVLYLYNFFSLGKAILYIAQKLGLLSFPVCPEEKKGLKSVDFPKKYPNVQAEILLEQLSHLEEFKRRRWLFAKSYFELLHVQEFKMPKKVVGATYLRFNLQTDKASEIRYLAKRRGILLGNWYGQIVDPSGVSLVHAGYTPGSCPNAEKAARECLNLPTYPWLTESQVKRIAALLNDFGLNKRRF